MRQVPQFAYPGSKNRLARRIISLMPPSGERFVDVFAGRGALSWHVMALLDYKKHWINAWGTYDMFDALRAGDLYNVPPRQRRALYDRLKTRLKMAASGEIRAHRNLIIRADLVKPPNDPKDVLRGDVRISRREHRLPRSQAQPAELLESYVCFSGGSYDGSGFRGDRADTNGGVSREGYEKNVEFARRLMVEKRPRLTELDYRDVLAECGHDDVVYVDPCYKGIDTGTYSDKTVDHHELVQILLRANFKWILSEYWHPIYAPLGEPLRIEVYSPIALTRKRRVECLWTNFEPHYLTERKRMPKIDSGDLLAALQKERDDIDAAIRALTRTINKNFNPDAPDAAKPAKPPKTRPPQKGKRKLSAESRKKLSEAAKKRWANKAKA